MAVFLKTRLTFLLLGGDVVGHESVVALLGEPAYVCMYIYTRMKGRFLPVPSKALCRFGHFGPSAPDRVFRARLSKLPVE